MNESPGVFELVPLGILGPVLRFTLISIKKRVLSNNKLQDYSSRTREKPSPLSKHNQLIWKLFVFLAKYILRNPVFVLSFILNIYIFFTNVYNLQTKGNT